MLLIWGAQDKLIPLAGLTNLSAALPQASTLVIPNSGHFCYEETPVEFNAALLNYFLKEVPEVRPEGTTSVGDGFSHVEPPRTQEYGSLLNNSSDQTSRKPGECMRPNIVRGAGGPERYE